MIQSRDGARDRGRRLFHLSAETLFTAPDREKIRQAACLLLKVSVLLDQSLSPEKRFAAKEQARGDKNQCKLI